MSRLNDVTLGGAKNLVFIIKSFPWIIKRIRLYMQDPEAHQIKLFLIVIAPLVGFCVPDVEACKSDKRVWCFLAPHFSSSSSSRSHFRFEKALRPVEWNLLQSRGRKPYFFFIRSFVRFCAFDQVRKCIRGNDCCRAKQRREAEQKYFPGDFCLQIKEEKKFNFPFLSLLHPRRRLYL